jgi:meso-butanediol dehydrogenase/(S,S)-butanediol dehydrogenase/diacetyl reductase
MTVELAGRVAIVTGAAAGIGEAVALRVARDGAAVLVADLDRSGGERVVAEIAARGGRAAFCEADVSERAQVDSMFEAAERRFGAVGILVNNVAVGISDGLLVMEEDAWDREIATSLKSVFLCTKRALPGMIEARAGAIVNMASVSGLAYFGLEAYSAAKAGMISLTKANAVRYGPYGIRVNAVAPGSVYTPAWDKFISRDPELLERVARWYPLRRMGTTTDVANAVSFLISDEASWISGTVLGVDGGLMAGNAVMVREIQTTTAEPFAP